MKKYVGIAFFLCVGISETFVWAMEAEGSLQAMQIDVPAQADLAGKLLSWLQEELKKTEPLSLGGVLSSVCNRLQATNGEQLNEPFWEQGKCYTPLTRMLRIVKPNNADILLVRWLLAHGINPNHEMSVPVPGWKAADFERCCCEIPVPTMQIEEKERKPLFCVSSPVFMRELVAAGARPVTLEDGNTAVHNAFCSWPQQAELIPMLIGHGVHPGTKNRAGRDALQELALHIAGEHAKTSYAYKLAALLTCYTPDSLDEALGSFGATASRCRESGLHARADELGALSRMLAGARERRQDQTYEQLSLQERFRKIYGDYIFAHNLANGSTVSEQECQTWADNVFEKLFPIDVRNSIEVFRQQILTRGGFGVGVAARSVDAANEPIAKRLRSDDPRRKLRSADKKKEQR
jgi:hypothetical protein